MPFRMKPFRDRLLNRLVERAPVEALAAGEAVISAGEPADAVVLVRDGHLCVEASSGGPARRVVDLVLPWELAGTEAVVRDGPYRLAVVAPGPASIQRLPGRDVRSVLRRAEGTFDALLLALDDRLALARALSRGGGPDAAGRLARLLLHLGARAAPGDPRDTDPRARPPQEDPLVIPFRIPHRTLGEMAGLHRSTVTTVLNDWVYRDLLEDADPGWRLPDPVALRRHALRGTG